MSQFTANDFADATKKKKKPGAGAMVGPPTIVPPVMQPWDQQVVGGYEQNLPGKPIANLRDMAIEQNLPGKPMGNFRDTAFEQQMPGVPMAGAKTVQAETLLSPQAALAQVLKQRTMARAAPQQQVAHSPVAGMTQQDFGPTGKYSGYPGGRYGSHPDVQRSPELTVAGAASPAGAQTQPQEAQPTSSGAQDILNRQRRQVLQRRFSQMAGGASPEQIAKADTMAEMRYEREALDRSGRPIQKVQSPSEVVGARDNIRQSLIQNADVIHKRAMDAIAANPQMQQTDPAQYAKLMEDVSRAENMRATAQTKLASYGAGGAGLENPEVTRIIGAQRNLATRQMADRGVGVELNEPYQKDANDTRGQGFKMRDLARRVEGAAGEAALAQTEQAGAEARIAGDPEIIKQRLAAERARATMEARMAGAQGSAGARDAAYSASGLGSAEAVAEFNNKAQRAISANDDEAFSLAVVPQLEQIAALDPQEAERLARSLLLVSQQSRPGVGSVIGDAISQAWRVPSGIGPDVKKMSAIKRAKIDSELRKFLISQ